MNPSAADWILKFLDLFDKSDLLGEFETQKDFYDKIKETGFIYGISVTILPKIPDGNLKLTKEELTKINLFHTLYFQYFKHNSRGTNREAIQNILTFYKELEKEKTGFFHKFSISQNPSNSLEHILAARIQATNSPFKKNTISSLTYALLYLDVLAYKHWQKNPKSVKKYYQELETDILRTCFYALKSKKRKSKYDNLMIDLFESSLNFATENSIHFLEKLTQFDRADDAMERYYILDLCCLAVWEDLKLDNSEIKILNQIAAALNLKEETLQNGLKSLSYFSEKYTEKIQLFEYSHPVKQFFQQSVSTVKLLIIRNKDRLARELEESGDLVVLLGQSTLRDLSPEEKSKVKKQLLEICKSIPSMTIFLLPGGSVLLPLLVKFIPKLLPSSFRENKIEINKKQM